MADTVLADTGTDEGLLLALLNSTPVIDGVPADDLADPVRARAWQAAVGGRGTEAELRHVLRVRQALQAVVRGQQPAAVLAPELAGVSSVPAIDDGRSIGRARLPVEQLPSANGGVAVVNDGHRCSLSDRIASNLIKLFIWLV